MRGHRFGAYLLWCFWFLPPCVSETFTICNFAMFFIHLQFDHLHCHSGRLPTLFVVLYNTTDDKFSHVLVGSFLLLGIDCTLHRAYHFFWSRKPQPRNSTQPGQTLMSRSPIRLAPRPTQPTVPTMSLSLQQCTDS